MKTLFLDCGMGAAGDMLAAALLELLPDPDGFVKKLNALSIPGVRIQTELTVKAGITGTHFTVMVDDEEEDEEMHDHEHLHSRAHTHFRDDDTHSHIAVHTHVHEPHTEHHHSGPADIRRIVEGLELPDKVREDVLAVYRLIAEAESHVHGVPVTDIHFHEVGTMDAVTDITAVCMLMNELSPDEVIASPVHVGCGQVRCAHGILPVPAPATLYILRDVPIYGGEIQGELCTPTGAALLKHFVSRFEEMPLMRIHAVGYGMGKKEFPRANCLRAVLGEKEDRTGAILELSCNVDDMTPEAVGFAMERLFEAGAKDVYTIPVGMKKSRPGTMICVLCEESDREAVIRCLFKHTTTIGIRENMMRRYVLNRTIETVSTVYGDVRRKLSSGYGVSREKYEYDDLVKIAEEKGLTLDDVRRQLP